MLLTGDEFNELYDNTVLIKLSNKSEDQDQIKLQTGLNESPFMFDIDGKYKLSGITFCRLDDIAKFLKSSEIQLEYTRYVKIPDDAKIYVVNNDFRADKLILLERNQIKNLQIWRDRAFIMSALTQNESVFQYINGQSFKFYLLLVKQNGMRLEYITNSKYHQFKPTLHELYELCLAAVKQTGYALRFINDMPETELNHVYLEAVKRNGWALEYVPSKNRTNEICLAAVKQSGGALEYVDDQTDEICLEAVKKSGDMLEYVKNQTDEICLAAVENDPDAFEYVKHQTDEICLAAVKGDGTLLEHIKHQTDEICLESVKNCGNAIQYVINKTPEICLTSVKSYGAAIMYIDDQTDEMCMESVNKDGMMVLFVKNKTKEICLAACEQNVEAFEHIGYKFWDHVRNNVVIPNDVLRKVGINVTD
jgi:hypothetical protein